MTQPDVDPGTGSLPAERAGAAHAGAARRAEWLASIAFLVAAGAGGALLVLYAAGGQTQLEGILLTICLAGLGAGIAMVARYLTPAEEVIETRESLATPPDSGPTPPPITRRALLIRSLGAGLAGLAAALAIPVLSLGPAPGDTLRHTRWRRGTRLVGEDGQPVRAASLDVDSVTTVFPEGSLDDASAPALLIRVPDGSLRLPADRLAGAPGGYVAYSKVCTHAGCPVGLYRAAERRLICPCHQSTFDVLAGAQPTFGPAARPLPQLPIQQAADGTFVALDDFSDPVGPSFWDLYR
ncbi:MAG TPA: Rieske (2Fe-2S) protein [Candidatus Limnocylindria bacterium]|nr:Rieske (2Fe-2S) protein [Candidatus Limnocylindria bacterium]